MSWVKKNRSINNLGGTIIRNSRVLNLTGEGDDLADNCTQTIERDLVERSAYTMILGSHTKFLVNYLYVTGSNLDHEEGDFIMTSLLDNYN